MVPLGLIVMPAGVTLVQTPGAGGGVDAVLLRENAASPATPDTCAVTVKDPLVPFAVNAGAVAIPEESVVAVTVAEEPKRAEAPLAGAVNVTVAPKIGFAAPSRTSAFKEVPNVVLTTALCGVPAVAVTEAAT